MKFFDLDGNRPRATRQVSAGATITPGAGPEELARSMTELAKRIAQIEASQNQEAVEFEVDLPASGVVVLEHGFDGPVRYFVTHWKEAPTVGGEPT